MDRERIRKKLITFITNMTFRSEVDNDIFVEDGWLDLESVLDFIEQEIKKVQEDGKKSALVEVGRAFRKHKEETGCNVVADDCTWSILEDLYEGGKGVSDVEGGNKDSDEYWDKVYNLN